MNAFFHALAFFTRIPVPWLKPSEKAWRESVAWYPAVGLVIGCVLWAVYQLSLWAFSPLLAAVLTCAVWVYITGGLHLDGWMDLADGLGSSRSRERMLEIMKDSRSGAMAVLAAILLLLIKTAGLVELAPPSVVPAQVIHQVYSAILYNTAHDNALLVRLSADWSILLLIVPFAARTHVLLAIRFWPYASSDNGIGKGISEGLRLWHIAFAYVILLGLSWWLADFRAVTAVLVSLLFSLWFARGITRRLGGLTGDCYGAIIESSEAVMLVVLAGSWWG
ncbi:adenosylcobinamide-GDP ribazoletransferase [Brevibacillus ruminantium]|uniref:Adenosylcobinamide-GDP ribazoletransferase n=1 Tax=Brevibacillus ruminantium TaxID=2950604 RepID=A0ABY4WFF8_9BACL|nr:adenosylcobinamide-GDP ribazoletransferase [Brevibacillus ruminantium]USG64540.1 adenosylcobinamide-GDP ribazoletransferase [Brevibacillus ruminantium]